MKLEFKRKDQVAEDLKEEKNLPMLRGRHIAGQILCLLSDQRRTRGGLISSNNLLNNALRSDSLEMFVQARELTLMAMEQELERDLPESLYHRQLEKSSLMKTASALYQSDQAHCKGPIEKYKVESTGHRDPRTNNSRQHSSPKKKKVVSSTK